MKTSDLVVGISGLDSGANPHPGTAVAMALRRDPEFTGRLVALTYDPMVPGAWMEELFDDVALVPWPGDHEDWYRRCIPLARKELGLNVLLPCLDSDMPTVSRLQHEWSEMGIHTLAPDEDAVKSRFKWNLNELCDRAGLATPRTGVLYDTAQLHPLDGWSFPLYIKGSLADAELAHNDEEAAYLFRKMVRKWGYPVMAQECRAGVEYLVAGAVGHKGLLGRVAVRKGELTAAGKATTGVTVDDPDLMEAADRLLDVLKWRGPFELEFMRDATSGEFLLIEINGRFPAWISFAREAGAPLVRLTVEEACGMNPKPMEDLPAGLFFTRAHLVSVGNTSDLKVWQALARAESNARNEPAAGAGSKAEIE